MSAPVTDLAQLTPAQPRRFIYFVQAGDDGPVKIGITTDIRRRLTALRTGSPAPLRLLGHLPANSSFEKGLHRRLAAARLHGEWFKPTREVLAWARIAEIIDGRRRSEMDPREVDMGLAERTVPA